MSTIHLFIDGKDANASVINATIQSCLGDASYFVLYVLACQKPMGDVLSLRVKYHGYTNNFLASIKSITRNRRVPNAYEIKAVSFFKFFCHQQTYRRCFSHQTIPQIIKSILSHYPKLAVSWSLCCRPAVNCEYIVQYDETDFMFIRRLMSLYGYSYYWDEHTMVIIDDIAGYRRSKSTISPFYTSYVYQWVPESCRLIKGVSLSAAIRPSVFNICQTIYEPGTCAPVSAQQRLGHVADRLFFETAQCHFASQSLETSPGRCLPNQDFVVTEVMHHFYIAGQVLVYENHGMAIPSRYFRPLPHLAPPLCDEIHSAEVVDIENGRLCRVRLRYDWDLNRSISPWVPVLQAGAGRETGIQFMPCVGDRVLVRYECGDLTCPIIIGMPDKAGDEIQIGHPDVWLSANPSQLRFSASNGITFSAKQKFEISTKHNFSMTINGHQMNTWRCHSLEFKTTKRTVLRVGRSRLHLSESGIVLSADEILLNSDDHT